MNTDHPTVDLYFVLAYTYCKLAVYETEKIFAMKILEALDVEFFDYNGENCMQVDTRLLLDLVKKAYPTMVANAVKSSLCP